MIPIVLFPSVVPEDGDGLADSYYTIDRYVGAASTIEGTVQVGINDEDTVKILDQPGTITEGSALSMHNDAGTSYQNTSGFDAIALLTITAVSAGVATRHVKIWSSPNNDSITSGTLVHEFGEQDTLFFDTTGDIMTLPPVRIQNNHYIVIENIDDSRDGSNDVAAFGAALNGLIRCIAVERGA